MASLSKARVVFIASITYVLMVGGYTALSDFPKSWTAYWSFERDRSCNHDGTVSGRSIAGNCHTENVLIDSVDLVQVHVRDRKSPAWMYRYTINNGSGFQVELTGPIETSQTFNQEHLIHKNIAALIYADQVIALYPQRDIVLHLSNDPVKPLREELLTFISQIIVIAFVVCAFACRYGRAR